MKKNKLEMVLSELEMALDQNDTLGNNYKLAYYWHENAEHDKAMKYAELAMKYEKIALLIDVNKLRHLLVSIIYAKSYRDIDELKKALPLIQKINDFEGEDYKFTPQIERRIAELEKGDEKGDEAGFMLTFD